jgi:predicted secreted Zn-dependent protease
MTKDNQREPDPDTVEKMLESLRDDMDIEMTKQKIGQDLAQLSSQWSEAKQRGDKGQCEEIEHRMRELIQQRKAVGVAVHVS